MKQLHSVIFLVLIISIGTNVLVISSNNWVTKALRPSIPGLAAILAHQSDSLPTSGLDAKNLQ